MLTQTEQQLLDKLSRRKTIIESVIAALEEYERTRDCRLRLNLPPLNQWATALPFKDGSYN